MFFTKIERWSLRYALLKAYFRFTHNFIFYRKIEVVNNKNIPYDKPIIFAPNHQNALMDPLAVLAKTKGQTVFLARADIFKNPKIASILHFLKILPVYRIRDGISTLQNNEDIFDRIVGILKNKGHVCILPEGSHDKHRRLRQLGKGVFRIAFNAEEDKDFNLGLVIIPVGLDYEDFYKAQSKLLINFGEPIKVSDYRDSYKENPQKALNQLKNDFTQRLSSLMIDIQNEEYYETYLSLREICNSETGKKKGLKAKLDADKELISRLNTFSIRQPQKMQQLHLKVQEYSVSLAKLNFRDWLFKKRTISLTNLLSESLIFLLLSPLYLYGLITHYIPYKLPVWLVKAPKDPQFTTSFRFPIFMFFIPVWYLLLILPVMPFLYTLYLKLAYSFSLPLLGMFSMRYYLKLRKLMAKWRLFLLKRRNYQTIESAQNLRKEIIDLANSL